MSNVFRALRQPDWLSGSFGLILYSPSVVSFRRRHKTPFEHTVTVEFFSGSDRIEQFNAAVEHTAAILSFNGATVLQYLEEVAGFFIGSITD